MGRDERWSWTRIDVGMHRWFWHRKRGYLDRRHVAPTSFVVWPIEAGTSFCSAARPGLKPWPIVFDFQDYRDCPRTKSESLKQRDCVHENSKPDTQSRRRRQRKSRVDENVVISYLHGRARIGSGRRSERRGERGERVRIRKTAPTIPTNQQRALSSQMNRRLPTTFKGQEEKSEKRRMHHAPGISLKRLALPCHGNLHLPIAIAHNVNSL